MSESRQQLALETAQRGSLLGTNSDSGSEAEDAGDDQNGGITVRKQRLRSALELQHVCAFFSATACFQIKSDPELTIENSDEFKKFDEKEAKLYEEAKCVRKELLVEAAAKATALMSRVADLKRSNTTKLPIIPRFDDIRGIESRRITEEVDEVRGLLNAQAGQLADWRQKLIDLLLLRLVDQDEDVEMTGEEYELSTKSQDTQYVYIDALRASFADRNHMINGVYSLLIDMEMKGAHKLAVEGEGHDPELFKDIYRMREKLKLPQNSTLSLRGIMAELRTAITSVRWQETGHGSNRAAAEAAILEGELERLQSVTSTQAKALTGLEKELDLFRSTMNQRLEFYRQLQQISDMVAPLQEEMDAQVDEGKLELEVLKEAKHAERLSALSTKRRFLLHLRSESTAREEQRICVICQSSFELGVLTVCGHQYCKECITLWWAQHHSCPMCKRVLKLSDFHNITYKPRELRAQEEQTAGSIPEEDVTHQATPTQSSIYSSISTADLDIIKRIDLPGSFGTKIDTLSRHLLWLRDADPGAKCIIFSQYRDFLGVLSKAFVRFNIGHANIADKHGIERFKEDPGVQCFLLHAKADSSGLNLTTATHVFLCEPLINSALELQAIARIHRIGQRRATTVWMYLISDTVEEAIYDISVSRRLAHMQRSSDLPAKTSRAVTPSADLEQETEILLDAANSAQLNAAPLSQLMAKGASSGEVVSKDDLWSCLFGKSRVVKRGHSGDMEDEVERELGRGLRRNAAEARAVGV